MRGYSSVHRALGGGGVADVLLWRNWRSSIGLLAGSTAFWSLFELGGYSFLSFVANVLFLLVVILFFWAKSASLLNRPLPPLPDLSVSEETVIKAADVTREWMNKILLIAREIAIGGNLKRFGQVACGLWVVSFIGSFFNFLSLLYIGLLLGLSVPVVYEKYQDQVDRKLFVASDHIEQVCQRALRKLSAAMAIGKEKKTQ